MRTNNERNATVKAIVNKDTCTGCELCVQTCPEVFEMDDNCLARATADEVPSEARETCRQAADECPVEAIMITG